MYSDSSTTNYTFGDYCRAAQLDSLPDWADAVPLVNPPFAHQVGDLNHLAMHTRSGLWSEPGLGKTRSVTAYGLWLCGQGNKVVYTMPPMLVQQFQKALADTFLGYDQYVSCAVLQDVPKKRAALTAQWDAGGWPDLLVLSYRMFVDYHARLKEAGYTCVVVDEADAVKSPSAQLHLAVKTFAGPCTSRSNGVVLMTGTPVSTNIIDAYGLIALLNPQRYGSLRAFKRAHCDLAPAGVSRYDLIAGYKNLDYLHNGLMLAGRRIKKADVLDLPPRLVSELPVTLSRDHTLLYRRMVDERLLEIGDGLIDMTTQSALYQAVQQVLVCPEKFAGQPVKNALLEALDTVMASLQGRKVIIYCWYRGSLEKLAQRYKALNPACLYGGTGAAQREPQRLKFINDASCRLLLANPKSGGVGVDGLQAVCSHVIFAEVCPFPGAFQQAVDRCHRAGQSEPVTVYLLVPAGTISVKLRNDLLKKDSQQESVVKDKRALLKDLLGET